MRRLAALVVVALLAAAAFVAGRAGGGENGAGAPAAIPTGTAAVERRTLVEQEAVDGALGYGEARAVVNRGQGTVTELAPVGAVVERDGVLFRIDGAAVRLMYGEVPAYRRMAAGMSDGADVRQLEDGLRALGHFKGTPDDEWDSASTAAVERWQKANGEEQDGVVEDGEVLFLPGPARVAAHTAGIGSAAAPGAEVLEATGTARLVSVDLDARLQRLAVPGAKVDVELPDGKTTKGTIAGVGTVATASPASEQGGGEGDPTIPVVVSLDDPAAGGTLDGAPVEVRLTRESREGVLAVPVNALLALSGGGYGLERPDGSLVRVETGMFDDGWVEVQGEGLHEGMAVVVPA